MQCSQFARVQPDAQRAGGFAIPTRKAGISAVPSQQHPHVTRASARLASIAVCSARRVFPIPGSPPTRTRLPSPRVAARRKARRRASSYHPQKTGPSASGAGLCTAAGRSPRSSNASNSSFGTVAEGAAAPSALLLKSISAYTTVYFASGSFVNVFLKTPSSRRFSQSSPSRHRFSPSGGSIHGVRWVDCGLEFANHSTRSSSLPSVFAS